MNNDDLDQLISLGPQKTFTGRFLSQISFPMGGIGTGSIGLNGRGGLEDFEIFNRPNIGTKFPQTFPIIRVKAADEPAVAKILEGPPLRPYTPLDGGAYHANGEGFPHMRKCSFRGEYPFAFVSFQDRDVPVNVELEAYNPFIPSDPDASGYPIVILRYHVHNTSREAVEVGILWSLINLTGYSPADRRRTLIEGNVKPSGNYVNTHIEQDGVQGIVYGNLNVSEDHALAGSVALTTSADNDAFDVTYTPYWRNAGWFDSHYHLWNFYKEHGRLEPFREEMSSNADAGALSIGKTIQPGEKAVFQFAISWYFSNFVKYWVGGQNRDDQDGLPRWKNYYAQFFEDAFDVALKFHENEGYCYKYSQKFHDALFQSTLPPYVIEAIANNICTLKTPTCLRLPDGTFYGWEGCHADAGWCEGSCTHVWGYQQALPFLFPRLERSMHDANYRYNWYLDDFGALEFRLQLPPGEHHGRVRACADGQLGGVMHVYREWKLSGDDHWLQGIWPSVKRALEFAWDAWDEDQDGYLKEFQHNTYDIEFHGPNPMLTCYYLGALKSAAEMAEFCGDTESARIYRKIHRKGCQWVDNHLFDGEYYIQKHDPDVAPHHQVGNGCLIDQLVGQQIARVAGLDNFLRTENIKSALRSIFTYNYKTNMWDHENGARLYAVNDEAATLICTWPKGGRPEVTFPYADEVMNGFEYQFAVHCIYEDLLSEGLTVVKSIRDRFNGWARNPWDEFECGHHYARSMSSYGLLIALSGFQYDKRQGLIGFAPKIFADSFNCFWSMGGVWGRFTQTPDSCTISVDFGEIRLKSIALPQFLTGDETEGIGIESDGHSLDVKSASGGMIILETPVKLAENQELRVVRKRNVF